MFTGSPSQVKIDARPRGTEPTLSHLTSQLDRNRQLVRLPTIPSKIKCSHLRSALESIFAPAIHACFPLEGIRVFRRAAVPPSNFAHSRDTLLRRRSFVTGAHGRSGGWRGAP